MIGSMTKPKPVDDAPAPSTPVSPPATEPSVAHRPWLPVLVLLLVTVVAYFPVLRAGFIWDDDYHLTANPAMTARHGLKLIWTSLAVGRSYPLTLTTFWFEHRLWGMHPLPYHVANVLFHAASGVVLYFLLRRLRIPAAWLAAMVWTLHPVNVESVAWVTQLKNTQSGLFFFLSLLCFLKFAEEQQLSPRWYRGYMSGLWYVCAFGCAVAAMLSSASTAILPLALLLVVWWQGGYWEPEDTAVRLAPYFGMAWLVLGLSIYKQHGFAPGTATTKAGLGLAQHVVVAGKIIWFYAAKTLWPARLAFLYPRWTVDASSLWSWAPIAALVALGVALWWCRDRAWCRAVLFGGGYFVVMLLPVLGFVDLFFFRFSFVADHFQYLACLGLISLAVSAGAAVCWRTGHWGRVSGAFAAAIVLLALGVSTWRQARAYQNMETLWRDALTKNPGSWVAHDNLASVLGRNGKIGEAIAHYEQALRLKPDYAEAHWHLGFVLLREGKISDAIGHYEQAMQLEPDRAEPHYNLAVALERAGETDEAIAQYEQALHIQRDYAEAHWNLGYALLHEGRISDAIEHYEQAAVIRPDLPQLHYYLALVLNDAGRTDEAITHFEQALGLKPDYVEAHCSLGDVLRDVGRIDDAIAHYEQALRIKPDSAEAHYGLALALQQQDRTEEAFAHLEQALWIRPDYTDAQTALALLRRPMCRGRRNRARRFWIRRHLPRRKNEFSASVEQRVPPAAPGTNLRCEGRFPHSEATRGDQGRTSFLTRRPGGAGTTIRNDRQSKCESFLTSGSRIRARRPANYYGGAFFGAGAYGTARARAKAFWAWTKWGLIRNASSYCPIAS